MQVVGDLVRIDPDQGRVHLVDRAIESLLVDRPELAGEGLLQARVEEAPERAAPADEVLPRPALGLVQTERDTRAERRPCDRLVHAPLVDAVPELVHRREERAQVVRAEVRRQPDVPVSGAGHERMLGLVDPPFVVRVAEAAQHLEAERPLRTLVEGLVEEGVVDVAGSADLLDQRHELLLQLVEDLRGRRRSSCSARSCRGARRRSRRPGRSIRCSGAAARDWSRGTDAARRSWTLPSQAPRPTVQPQTPCSSHRPAPGEHASLSPSRGASRG